MMTIACVEACPYLRDARETTGKRLMEALVNALIAADHDDWIEDVKSLTPLLHTIEHAIVQVRREHHPDLTDSEVLAALSLALQTYETLQRGIIYQHTSESPRVQRVVEKILGLLDDLKKVVTDAGGRVSTEAIIQSLAVVKILASALQKKEDAQAYIRVASLYQPYPQEESRLIVVPE
ncbi:MAG TPA: hypothetical protein VNM72_05775 [Blastocatellia bacterium]|nr:hypothetical protein [Blastocatellia bacterium]